MTTIYSDNMGGLRIKEGQIITDEKYLVIKQGTSEKLVWADPKIYLQANGTQYINTGVMPTGALKTEVVAAGFGAGGENGSILGASDASYPFIMTASGSWIYYRFWGTAAHVATDTTYGKHTYSSDGNKGYYDGEQVYTGATPVDISRPLYLFGRNNEGTAGTLGSGSVYSCKIYNGNTPVLHLVPVPAGMVIGNTTISANCMFDIVSQTPYYNAGSGDFTIGQDA